MRVAVRRLVVALVAGTALILSAAPAMAAADRASHPRSAPRVGDFSVIGHRGFPYHGHTENTHLSFFDAYRFGATAEETDLHLTKDDVAILMHDPTLDRTTDCHGAVAAHTWASIRKHCRADDGQRLWSVHDLLTWDQRHHMNQLLDFKYTGEKSWTTDLLGRLAGQIDEAGMTQAVIVMSNSRDFLRRVEATDSQLHTQWIAPRWTSVEDVQKVADGVNLFAKDMTRARVRALHHAGLTVLGRNSDSTADWHRARVCKADGFLVNELRTYNKRYHL